MIKKEGNCDYEKTINIGFICADVLKWRQPKK